MDLKNDTSIGHDTEFLVNQPAEFKNSSENYVQDLYTYNFAK